MESKAGNGFNPLEKERVRYFHDNDHLNLNEKMGAAENPNKLL
jgi:hypothetical protein